MTRIRTLRRKLCFIYNRDDKKCGDFINKKTGSCHSMVGQKIKHKQSFLATYLLRCGVLSPLQKWAIDHPKRPSQALTDPFSPTHLIFRFSGTGLVLMSICQGRFLA